MLGRLAFEPQVLPAEDMAHRRDREAGRGESTSQRVGGKQRAVFVEEIPDHLMPEDPEGTGRLEEDACLRRSCQCGTHRTEQLQRVGDVFDHVTAHDDVSGHASRAVEEASLESQPPVEVGEWSLVTRVEPDADVGSAGVANQLPQEPALAATHFYDAATMHP